MTRETPVGHIVDIDSLPARFPTHRHERAFWESLGRAVATFGALEEILAKAIFAFTVTRPREESSDEQAYADWLPQLERALTDPLGNLIATYGKVVRCNPSATITDLDELLSDLQKASAMRNILCHGSWRPPNASGASVPFFVNRQQEVIESAMDCEYIDQVQRHAAELACSVMKTVTDMGWRFPGSAGPGKPVWES